MERTGKLVGYAADAALFCADDLPYEPGGLDGNGDRVEPLLDTHTFVAGEGCSVCGRVLVPPLGPKEEEP